MQRNTTKKGWKKQRRKPSGCKATQFAVVATKQNAVDRAVTFLHRFRDIIDYLPKFKEVTCPLEGLFVNPKANTSRGQPVHKIVLIGRSHGELSRFAATQFRRNGVSWGEARFVIRTGSFWTTHDVGGFWCVADGRVNDGVTSSLVDVTWPLIDSCRPAQWRTTNTGVLSEF